MRNYRVTRAVWRDVFARVEKEDISEEEKEHRRRLLEFILLLDDIDRRLKCEKAEGPKIAPPDEFWMDTEW